MTFLRTIKALWLRWKYRQACDKTCMCGDALPSYCSMGGCVSEKDYYIGKNMREKPEQLKDGTMSDWTDQ